jgi:hypothetical protein
VLLLSCKIQPLRYGSTVATADEKKLRTAKRKRMEANGAILMFPSSLPWYNRRHKMNCAYGKQRKERM